MGKFSIEWEKIPGVVHSLLLGHQVVPYVGYIVAGLVILNMCYIRKDDIVNTTTID